MSNILAIKNVQVVLSRGIIWDGVIIVKDGIIVDFGSERDVQVPLGATVLDGKGNYAGPGFIDIHVHAGGGYDTCVQPNQAAQFFLSHGTTTFLATPTYLLTLKEMLEAISVVKQSMQTIKNIAGIYFEGPFINPDYGAFAYENPWREEIPYETFKQFVDAAGDIAKVWTIAPERKELLPFLQYARQVNPSVVFAVGHSQAKPSQIRALGKYKPTIQTHSLNATGRIKLYGGTRSVGPDEYCLQDNDMFAELISDSCGIHVHPDMQSFLIHNKGIDKVILISDSTLPCSENPKDFSHVKDLNFDKQGGIAGSKITMDQACKNIMANTNCGISQAFIMASLNPARALGLDGEIGSIEIGKKANLVIVDDKFNVCKVIFEGEIKF